MSNEEINKKIAEIKSKYGNGEHVYFKNETLENICLFLSSWSYRLTKGLYFKVKYFLQRQTRGFDDLDKWNAGWFIARQSIKVLSEWRKGPIMGTSLIRHREDRFGEIVELSNEEIQNNFHDGEPPVFTEEEWAKVIDDIIFAFKFMLDDDLFVGDVNSEEYKQNHKRHKRGLKLFSIYLICLWD